MFGYFRSVVAGLLLPCVCLMVIGGCVENERYTVVYNGRDKQIVVTGKDVNAGKLVRKMIAANGWTSESAGSSSTNNSSFKVVNGVKYSKKSSSMSNTWITARARDGKVIKFDIYTENDNKSIIELSVDGDISTDTSKYALELLSWFSNDMMESSGRSGRRHINIVVANLVQDGENANVFRGGWVGDGHWDADYIRLEIRYNVSGRKHTKHIHMNKRELVGDSGATQISELTSFDVQRKGGTFTIGSNDGMREGFGSVRLAVYPEYLKAISDACSDVSNISDIDMILRVLSVDIDAEYAAQVSNVIKKGVTLDELFKLCSYHVKADYIEGFDKAGYSFSVKELIKLKSYHVGVEYAAGFKKAGYSFGAKELIKLKSYHVGVEYAAGFKKVGYSFGAGELIKANSYHLRPGDAAAFKKGGYDFGLDELIKLKSYHVDPESARKFKQGGYDFGINELIKAKSYHLNADYAVKLKKAGYDFGLDELIKIKSYRVSLDFMMKVSDAEYENFTADELIKMRRSNIDAETIVKLRKKKTSK